MTYLALGQLSVAEISARDEMTDETVRRKSIKYEIPKWPSRNFGNKIFDFTLLFESSRRRVNERIYLSRYFHEITILIVIATPVLISGVLDVLELLENYVSYECLIKVARLIQVSQAFGTSPLTSSCVFPDTPRGTQPPGYSYISPQ